MIVVSSKTVSLDDEIRLLIKTGKVIIGAKRAVRALKIGKAKGVVIADKIPPWIEGDVLYYAKLGGVKVIRYGKTSYELGTTCGKPFPISTIAILDPGESRLLEEGE